MKSQPRVSIIVPVHNVEKYICRAIDSVLNQTYTEVEMLIYNAASTDKTQELCETYAKQDDRIKVTNWPERVGPGELRNVGMQEAIGEYIMFMDGDDYIESDMVEKLVKKAMDTDSDLVISGYKQDFVDEEENLKYSVNVLPPEVSVNTTEEFLMKLPVIDVAKVFSFSWNKLYRAEILKEHKIEFPDLLHSEDYFFALKVAEHVGRVTTIPESYYHYIKRNNASLTNQLYHKDFTELMSNRFICQVELLKKYNVFVGETKELACTEHVKNIFLSLENECSKASPLSGRERRAMIKEMLKDDYTLVAIKNSRNISKMMLVLNTVIKTKSVLIIDACAKFIYFLRNNMASVYHKAKTK